MCERVAFLTKHHLIPKQVRKMSLYNMHDQVTVKLCIPCHRKVHQLFPNWKLKDTYNTVEKLKSHPLIKEHIEYTRKENPNILPVANGKSNRLQTDDKQVRILPGRPKWEGGSAWDSAGLKTRKTLVAPWFKSEPSHHNGFVGQFGYPRAFGTLKLRFKSWQTHSYALVVLMVTQMFAIYQIWVQFPTSASFARPWC